MLLLALLFFIILSKTARITLYLAVETPLGVFFCHSVATHSIAGSHRKTKTALKRNTAKEQGVTNASDPKRLQKNVPKNRPPYRSLVLRYNTLYVTRRREKDVGAPVS